MVAFIAIAALLAIAPAAVSDDVAPRGAVGGVRSPAAGILELSVLANDDGLGLSRAAAALDGEILAAGRFGDGTCVEVPDADAGSGCPAHGETTLSLPTAGVPDGAHTLSVIAQDAAGNVGTLVQQTITVANTPPPQHSSVTVTVGSGTTTGPPSSGPGGGGVAGEGDEHGCRSPRLSMLLAQRPLRFHHGVPVLARGRAYRFSGRLTCRVDGRRRSARRGTAVELRSLVRGRIVAKRRLKVGRHGRLAVRVASRSSRVLVFRVRGTGGTLARVKIPVRVVSHTRARAAQDPGTPVGGIVPSFLKLVVDDAAGFGAFPAGPGEYELAIHARVTASDPRSQLTVADGDVADGRRLGRLASAASVLAEPLEARAGDGAFASLDATVDPLLEVFSRPVAGERVTVRLRQRIEAGERPRGSYSKTIFLTLSPEAP
jgi:hypothetical protein